MKALLATGHISDQYRGKSEKEKNLPTALYNVHFREVQAARVSMHLWLQELSLSFVTDSPRLSATIFFKTRWLLGSTCRKCSRLSKFHGPGGLGSREDAQNHNRTKSERSSGKVANLQLLGCLPTLHVHDFPPPTLACHQILGTRGLESYSPHWDSWKKRQVRPSPIQGRSLAYMVPASRPRLTWQGSVTETMRPPWVNKVCFAL